MESWGDYLNNLEFCRTSSSLGSVSVYNNGLQASTLLIAENPKLEHLQKTGIQPVLEDLQQQ